MRAIALPLALLPIVAAFVAYRLADPWQQARRLALQRRRDERWQRWQGVE